ncbi:MAG: hypothetical protein ACE5FA_03860 [Dehalococcoidia bacterium]
MMRLLSFGVALLCLIVLVSCGDSDEDVSPTITATDGASPMPSATASPTPALETYRNEKYGYKVALPPGWRVATTYMEAFADRLSVPTSSHEPPDYVVLTSLSESEEIAAVTEAMGTVAIGLSPWYGFAQGQAVHIFPMAIVFQGASRDDFLTDVDRAGIIRLNEGETQVLMDSGGEAIRLTRREADDNGDFTYDVALTALATGEDVIVRIVASPGYAIEAFEAIFSSFRLVSD